MEKPAKLRLTGIVLVAIGFAVPALIDWYETVNYLDIKRDIGVLPWVIVGAVGFVLILASFFKAPGHKPRK